MTVYIDDMYAPFRGMLMCHMVADTTEELLQMATKIGMDHKWIQRPGTHLEHFDISEPRRALAAAAGAREISWEQCGLMCANRAHTGNLGDPETAVAEYNARVVKNNIGGLTRTS